MPYWYIYYRIIIEVIYKYITVNYYMSPFRNSKGVSRVFTTTTNLQVQVGQLMLTQGTTHRVYASPPRPSLSFSITYICMYVWWCGTHSAYASTPRLSRYFPDDDVTPIACTRLRSDPALFPQMMVRWFLLSNNHIKKHYSTVCMYRRTIPLITRCCAVLCNTVLQ